MNYFSSICPTITEDVYTRALKACPNYVYVNIARVMDGSHEGRQPGVRQLQALTEALINFSLPVEEWLHSYVSINEVCWLGMPESTIKLCVMKGATWYDVLETFETLPAQLQEVYQQAFAMHGITGVQPYRRQTEFSPFYISGSCYRGLRVYNIDTVEQLADMSVDFHAYRYSQAVRFKTWLQDRGYTLRCYNTREHIVGIKPLPKKQDTPPRVEEHLLLRYGGVEGFYGKLEEAVDLPVQNMSVKLAEALRDLAVARYDKAHLRWKDGVGVVLSIM